MFILSAVRRAWNSRPPRRRYEALVASLNLSKALLDHITFQRVKLAEMRELMDVAMDLAERQHEKIEGLDERIRELTPNPGSDAAADMGCLCPCLDNGFGTPERREFAGWVLNDDCVVHVHEHGSRARHPIYVKDHANYFAEKYPEKLFGWYDGNPLT